MKNKLEELKQNNDMLLQFTSRKLISKIDALVSTLQREKENLENEDYIIVNGLGIVQGQGTEIDTLCAKLSEIVRMKEELEK